ncbi:MAG: UDP-N-acetylmuramoyl-tripeptide--D-alanyl-D-alanine ligase [Bacteroidota bacterium]|nr:UDP-N-acetylmuramoyl-tripeptide--D-alanyl-D-alanine ligase [Bacteroidota bacterium]
MKGRIHELYDLFLKCNGISTDSRHIDKGDLFFALKGENFNGNKFAAEALRKGALAAIVDEATGEESPGVFKVENVLQSLQELAIHHRSKLKIPIIGITGSNGKTTTKELIHAVLSAKYISFATSGNLNNHIGAPVSILSIPEESEIAVIELGANHIGEIALLCRIVQPDHGLITNIGKAHIEGFGSIDGVIQAKTELYKYLDTNNGLVFVNADDDLLVKESGQLRRITYGTHANADYHMLMINEHPFIDIFWEKAETEITIKTKLYGDYNFQNVNAAIAIGGYFKIEPEKIRAGIESYSPENNRSQLIQTLKNTIYLDAYNANPSSMELAINNFNTLPQKQKILILGDMMELGHESTSEHQKIIDLVKALSFEKIIFCGEHFQALLEKTDLVFPNVQEAKSWLSINKISGSAILLKGSRKIELEKLLDIL